ncbi:hypothetical protein I5907_01985 [Panacibacter sp. DH6]|uniref:Transposase n=1 Tax=Panacibacter microcysteis TaxID=2793269 RepID=A0A931GU40_9BACT|nr:hypothetical protein [Panacibacter microcysteis]MBG9374980.1 hypothetical protein [Panacibacter microcysteis]
MSTVSLTAPTEFLSGNSVETKKKGVKHKIFEDSFDCKECFTYEFIQQKLQYMHYNPVKAGLVNIPELYEHSSAKFYITGEQGIYPVTHYAELYERGNN